MITQKELKSLLHYNPDTGEFTWLKKFSGIKSDMSAGTINKRVVDICINKKTYRAHRLAWLYVHGKMPDNCIDHINGNSFDNRLCNLRDVTHQENMKNMKRHSTNKSGISGVSWDKKNEKWRVNIYINNKCKNLGRYDDFFEACCVRKSAEIKLGYSLRHGR